MAQDQRWSNFEYRPLESQDSFRILRLRGGQGRYVYCDLIHSNILDGKVEYEAVSYTWGTDFYADTVRFEGHGGLHVTLNLSLILHDLRYDDRDRFLWVDSLCIDQHSTAERSSQVQRMGEIYRRATRVLLCIGRPNEMTDLLFDVFTRLASDELTLSMLSFSQQWEDLKSTMEEEFFGLMPRLNKAFEHISSQEWFYRIWIVQEVINAQQALVYCGRHHLSAEVFSSLPQILNFTVSPHVGNILSMMPSQNRVITHRTLSELINALEGSKATDKRDKIFALLDICSDPEPRVNLQPDYAKTEQRVIVDVVEHLCGCKTETIQPLPWSRIDDFIRFHNQHNLHNEIFDMLSKSRDSENAHALLQNHGEKLKIDSRLVLSAARHPSHELMGSLLNNSAFEKTLLVLELSSEIIEWAYDNRHEVFLDRLAAMGRLEDADLHLSAKAERDSFGMSELLFNSHSGMKSSTPRSFGNLSIRPLALAVVYGLEFLCWRLLARNFTIGPCAPLSSLEYTFHECPVLLAAAFGRATILELLLESGASDQVHTSLHHGLLYYAVANGHVDIVDCLLKRGLNPHAKHACKSPVWDNRLQKELEYHADWTLAHAAASLKQPDILKLLVRWGADAEAFACCGHISPLMVAVGHRRLDTISYLLGRGVRGTGLEPLIALYQYGTSSEYHAEMSQALATFEHLIRHGVDMEGAESGVPSAIVAAALLPYRSQIVLKLMKRNGVDFASAEGSFALYMTTFWQAPRPQLLLKAYGAEVADDPTRISFGEKEQALRSVLRYVTRSDGTKCASAAEFLSDLERSDDLPRQYGFDFIFPYGPYFAKLEYPPEKEFEHEDPVVTG